MALTKDQGNLLETMEESQNTLQDDKAVWSAKVESAWTGKLPKRNMESSINAEPGPNQ